MQAESAKGTPTILITRENELRAAASRLATARRLAVDIESNGLYKYQATLCVMQIATEDEVVIVDTIAVPLGSLRDVLGPNGPRKLVHDVAFDARILAEADLVLANVLDTSIAARMLGRQATGLASLMGAELGIAMDKKLQHHDWTERPIRAAQLRYLADDVIHLDALADKLWAEVEERGIGDAIEEETRYRLSQAIASANTIDPRPAWVRLKGIDRATPEQQAILRHLATLREHKAKSLDVPPYKVIGPDVLFAIAEAKPRTMDELGKIRSATGGHRARTLGPAMLEAVAKGTAEGAPPEDERMMLDRPRLPQSVVKARRARENRLSIWRKRVAKERTHDEQVVLPGHCLQDLADLDDEATLATITSVPGIGAFRVARDGLALLAAIVAPPATELAETPATSDAATSTEPGPS